MSMEFEDLIGVRPHTRIRNPSIGSATGPEGGFFFDPQLSGKNVAHYSQDLVPGGHRTVHHPAAIAKGGTEKNGPSDSPA